MTNRIILIATALDNMAGGLERNIVRIAGALTERGHTVDLVSFDLPAAQAFFPLRSGVAWHKIGRVRPHGKVTFTERLRLIGALRVVLRPRAGERVTAIAFHHGLLFRLVAASVFLPIRRICSERNALTIYDHIHTRKWRLNFLLLHAMHKITVQFPSYITTYPASLRARIGCIPNIVEPAVLPAVPAAPGPQGRYRLLAVGRLAAQKNFDLLIAAFAGLAPLFPEWDLMIAGEGETRAALEQQIATAGLAARITLPGAIHDLAPVYAASHLFAMPSRWEGFPNALAEALAAGLPAIGFATCDGVRDLIQDGVNGQLAREPAALATVLAALMASPERRAAQSAAARRSVAAFEAARILPLWEELATT